MTPCSQDLDGCCVDLAIDDEVHAFDFHSFVKELRIVGEYAAVVKKRTHSTIGEKLFGIERLRRKLQDPPTSSFYQSNLQWE